MAKDCVVLLDESTANRIAAGEVIERPASAAKELVENAIDAHATQISVCLEEGGKKCITVTDNGQGMSRADAVLALQRHATSKIKSADDLFAIRTLGFRGEALPSIASVSHLELITKQPDSEHGIRLQVSAGEIDSVDDVVARDGTTIQVSDLFFNTPARLKFLKSTPSEVGRVMEMVGHLAIAHPSIGFRVRQQAHEALVTPGTGEPLAALASIWGRETARKLVPIHFDSPGLSVSGHIATPELTRTGRAHELFYVNRRPIKNRMLAHALEDAFRSLTPDSRYPIAAIFVEIDPSLVDVNVHPTKTEVKFTRDGDVHHAVSQAVKGALNAYGVVPTPRVMIPSVTFEPARDQTEFTNGFDFRRGAISTSYEFGALGESVSSSHGNMDSATPNDGQMSGLSASPHETLSLPRPQPGANDDLDPFADVPCPKPFAEQLREFQVLGQARNTYIIALTPDGIAVIDQHVAHERVLYERLTQKRFAGGIPVQRLVMPVTLNLGRREALLAGAL